jgi:CheY-like chemotaxis protein
MAAECHNLKEEAVSTERKTILFVDDDTDFLEVIRSLAQESKGDRWNVLIASTTAQALRLLGTHPIDLAVLDLRMPIVDGIQFLQLIHRKYPQMKKALLSSYPDDARRQNAGKHGAELVLTKPLGVESNEILFETLDELVHSQSEDGFRGVLRKIGLEDILQMECLSRHTSLLEVVAGGQRGRIYIRSGNLVHAEFGSSLGEAALNELLALRGGEFNHAPYAEPPAETLEGSWEFLLMEAARHRDELMAATADHGSTARTPVTAGTSLVKEIVVGSLQGEVLFERDAGDASERVSVIKLLHNVGRKLEGFLPFGSLERVEFPGDEERLLVRMHDQGGLFIRGEVAP